MLPRKVSAKPAKELHFGHPKHLNLCYPIDAQMFCFLEATYASVFHSPYFLCVIASSRLCVESFAFAFVLHFRRFPAVHPLQLHNNCDAADIRERMRHSAASPEPPRCILCRFSALLSQSRLSFRRIICKICNNCNYYNNII